MHLCQNCLEALKQDAAFRGLFGPTPYYSVCLVLTDDRPFEGFEIVQSEDKSERNAGATSQSIAASLGKNISEKMENSAAEEKRFVLEQSQKQAGEALISLSIFDALSEASSMLWNSKDKSAALAERISQFETEKEKRSQSLASATAGETGESLDRAVGGGDSVGGDSGNSGLELAGRFVLLLEHFTRVLSSSLSSIYHDDVTADYTLACVQQLFSDVTASAQKPVDLSVPPQEWAKNLTLETVLESAADKLFFRGGSAEPSPRNEEELELKKELDDLKDLSKFYAFFLVPVVLELTLAADPASADKGFEKCLGLLMSMVECQKAEYEASEENLGSCFIDDDDDGDDDDEDDDEDDDDENIDEEDDNDDEDSSTDSGCETDKNDAH